MKKLLAVLILSALAPSASFAKARTLSDGGDNPTAISAEFWGKSIDIWSINFDHMVTDDVALGAGFSMWSGLGVTAIGIPVYLNYYFMEGPFRPYLTGGFEILTAGGGGISGSGAVFDVGGGVEYRAPQGFLFRGGVYLFFGASGGTLFRPGVSVGYAF